MPLLIVLLLLGAVLYWAWSSGTVVRRRTSGPDGDRRLSGLLGTPLARVHDPRLAATILMLQLVRTGSPITAAEKTAVMELMEDPLGIANIEATFVRAWTFTDGSRSFAPVSDELVPMLRRRLKPHEHAELAAMLRKVAGAYGEPSELQIEAIDRLERELARQDKEQASIVASRFGD